MHVALAVFALLAAPAALADAGDFAPAPTSPEPVATWLSGVAVGDFNGDGNLDQAVTRDVGSPLTSIFILLGDGRGNFTVAPTSPEPAAAGAQGPAVGDFDQDGNLDLAMADVNLDTVWVLLGEGTGDFSPAPGTPTPVGNNPRSVVVGDFNGDGNADLATANTMDDTVTVLFGTGTGAFIPAPTSPEIVGDGPVFIVLGDFDGDGNQDLATANGASDDVSVLLGNGGGDFTPVASAPVGDNPRSLIARDFDGNGRTDLAVVNGASNNVSILLGAGGGAFIAAPTSPEPIGADPFAIAAGDLDRDGDVDLAVTNGASRNVSILLGDGGGGFAAPATSPEAVSGDRPWSIAAADFDSDDYLDLAIPDYSPIGGVNVLLNQPSADLSVGKADAPDPVAAGDLLTYTIPVSNAGADEATGVRVVDDLPDAVDFVAVRTTAGSCSHATVVTCDLGTLPRGSSARVQIDVRPRHGGTLTNVARVTGRQTDPRVANNEAAVQTAVIDPPAQPVRRDPPVGTAGDRLRPRIVVRGVPRRRCLRRVTVARVSIRDASDLRRARVFVNGRLVRTTRRKSFRQLIAVRPGARGRLTIRALDEGGNSARRTVRFRTCAARAIAPRFTG